MSFRNIPCTCGVIEDGSCRCTDPSHHEMVEWGYVWNTETGHWE